MERGCLTVLALHLCGPPAAAAERVHAPPERALSAFSEDPARQFDFWIGRWDVNLRILQDDMTFQDSVKADTHVYGILNGAAILELWDSGPIEGYSLRYYDASKGRWVLWLDWPGRNRSRVSSLEGEFRHGRGDFLSRSTDPGGEELLQRYSFNDITPFSLRWDDVSSEDGGRTWSESWRMEFTRTAVDPPWPIPRDAVPTFADGGRCDDRRFRPYEAIAGSWAGDGARLEAYRILDGCAVMAFLAAPPRHEFLFLTFIGGDEVWETDVLDSSLEGGLMRFRGKDGWTSGALETGEPLSWAVEGDRLEYRRGERRLSLTRKRGDS